LRLQKSFEALQALSQKLSLGELFQLAPPHVTSLVICCPPSMRLIPWASVLIEAEGFEAQVEVPLVERYVVRLAPTLAIFELCCVAGSRLRQALGLHKMCLVDGNVNTRRDSSLELRLVSNTWSLDQNDYDQLSGPLATPTVLRTTPFQEFRRNLYRTRNAQKKAKKTAKQETLAEKERRRKTKEQERSHAYISKGRVVRQTRAEGYSDSGSEGEEKASDSDGSDEEGPGGRFTRKLQGAGDDASDSDDSRDSIVDDRERYVQKALELCRVLHVSAGRSPRVDVRADGQPGSGAALLLAPEREHREETGRSTLDAKALVKQLYLRNCGLCVLSNFGQFEGITKDHDSYQGGVEFLEALHLAGASTLVYPLWTSLQVKNNSKKWPLFSSFPHITLIVFPYAIIIDNPLYLNLYLYLYLHLYDCDSCPDTLVSGAGSNASVQPLSVAILQRAAYGVGQSVPSR
jgi:hypothetical protein